jgi:hypothetical protein
MKSFRKVIPLLIILTYFVLQLLFINADTPHFLTTDVGTYCDEGYKTLDARNLVLFGKRHWTDYDQYSGWLNGSPVTVGINFLIFTLFGVSISAARFCSLLFSLGTLSVLYIYLRSAYDIKIAFICLLLFIVNQVFFFYSRLALFEIKMLFFICCALWFLQLAKNNRLFIFPAILSSTAAYFTKITSLTFFLALSFYYLSIYKDGFLIKKFLEPKKLFFLIMCLFFLAGLVQYNFHYFEHFEIMGRLLRSPINTFFKLPPPEFFKKNPVLIFLTFSYGAYLVVNIMGGKKYQNEDIFFIIWFLLGVTIHSSFSYRPLRYYVIYVVPMTILAVRGIFLFPEVVLTIISTTNRWIKGLLFVISVSFLITFLSYAFLSSIGIFEDFIDFGKKHFISFSFGLVFFLSALYVLLTQHKTKMKKEFFFLSKASPILIVLVIFGLHLMPIFKWATNPRYDLRDIFQKINGLSTDPIIIGDWAPQLCINTKNRVLYSNLRFLSHKKTWWSLNFHNLDKIKPDFGVIVEGINDRYYKEFTLTYPGVLQKRPIFRLNYAGYHINLHKLDFP